MQFCRKIWNTCVASCAITIGICSAESHGYQCPVPLCHFHKSFSHFSLFYSAFLPTDNKNLQQDNCSQLLIWNIFLIKKKVIMPFLLHLHMAYIFFMSQILIASLKGHVFNSGSYFLFSNLFKFCIWLSWKIFVSWGMLSINFLESLFANKIFKVSYSTLLNLKIAMRNIYKLQTNPLNTSNYIQSVKTFFSPDVHSLTVTCSVSLSYKSCQKQKQQCTNLLLVLHNTMYFFSCELT